VTAILAADGMTNTDQSRRVTAARALQVGGILLLLAAAIHFFALPLLRSSVAARLSPEAFAFVGPPLVFSFLLDGILLLPLGFTALYCGGGLRRGERWAWVLGMVCGCVVLVLPFALLAVMGLRYFEATPFLAAALAVTAAGLIMVIPLLRLPRSGAAA
jgi:hypothetical protein